VRRLYKIKECAQFVIRLFQRQIIKKHDQSSLPIDYFFVKNAKSLPFQKLSADHKLLQISFPGN